MSSVTEGKGGRLSGRADDALALLPSPADAAHLQGSQTTYQAVISQVTLCSAQAPWRWASGPSTWRGRGQPECPYNTTAGWRGPEQPAWTRSQTAPLGKRRGFKAGYVLQKIGCSEFSLRALPVGADTAEGNQNLPLPKHGPARDVLPSAAPRAGSCGVGKWIFFPRMSCLHRSLLHYSQPQALLQKKDPAGGCWLAKGSAEAAWSIVWG